MPRRVIGPDIHTSRGMTLTEDVVDTRVTAYTMRNQQGVTRRRSTEPARKNVVKNVRLELHGFLPLRRFLARVSRSIPVPLEAIAWSRGSTAAPRSAARWGLCRGLFRQ